MGNSSNEWTRREWLQATAAGVTQAAMVAGSRVHAAAPQSIGVQLYTVRDAIKANPTATLEAIARIGYKEIELASRADIPTLAPLAKSVGLTATSTHIEAPLVTGNWEAWAPFMPAARSTERPTLTAVFDSARAHGIKYAVISYLMPGERGTTAAAYEKFADQLNRAGETARAAGLTLAYHNHAFEFAPLADGQRPFEVLASRLDKSLVKLELDVFWVSITGADPVDLVTRHKDVVALIHLKDKAKAAAAETDEQKVAPASFTEVGHGSLDFPAIVEAAQAAGVAHYYVEQDHTPGDPLASLRQSYEYLRTLA
jgi:sugar phosphate isomerase/epimerase